jgi:hypothetical protein
MELIYNTVVLFLDNQGKTDGRQRKTPTDSLADWGIMGQVRVKAAVR